MFALKKDYAAALAASIPFLIERAMFRLYHNLRMR
jgi:hypothetical protein